MHYRLQNKQNKLSDYIENFRVIVNKNPEYFRPYVDKIMAKDIVRNRIGDKYVVPSLLVFDNFDDIFLHINNFPNKFVIKYSMGCNRNIFVNKNFLNKSLNEANRHKTNRWKRTYYKCSYGEERQYWFEGRFLVEPFLDFDLECSVYCLDGRPKFFCVHNQKPSKWFNYYNLNSELLPINRKKYQINRNIDINSINIDFIIYFSNILCSNLQLVRIDFQIHKNNKITFGEFTLTPSNGNLFFFPNDIMEYI